MNLEAEIERLRAMRTVDRKVMEAIIETMIPPQKLLLWSAAQRGLEAFTVRALNSSMPEAFVSAQNESAAAWLADLPTLIAKKT